MSIFTLPNWGKHLERMPIANSITFAGADIERLFGYNDVARSRLKRRIVTYTDGCVVFHKIPPPAQ